MKTVFVDTSGIYAVLDRDDANHAASKPAWMQLAAEADLFTTNYILVETSALVQHRLGTAALRAFANDVVPLLRVAWVTEAEHRAAVEAVLAASRKKLSLVDCVSFEIMREYGVQFAFCFDAHFREQGFRTIPAG